MASFTARNLIPCLLFCMYGALSSDHSCQSQDPEVREFRMLSNEELIRLLGSTQARVRNEATKELTSRARMSLSSIDSRLGDPDPEIHGRLRHVLKNIYRSHCWDKPHYHISCTGKTVSQTLQELCLKEHCHISFGDPEGKESPPENVILETNLSGSFWEIIASLELYSGGRVRTVTYKDTLRCIMTKFDSARDLDVVTIDGIRFELPSGPVFNDLTNQIALRINCYGDNARLLLAGTDRVSAAHARADSGQKIDLAETCDEPWYREAAPCSVSLHRAWVYFQITGPVPERLNEANVEIELWCAGFPETLRVSWEDIQVSPPDVMSQGSRGSFHITSDFMKRRPNAALMNMCIARDEIISSFTPYVVVQGTEGNLERYVPERNNPLGAEWNRDVRFVFPLHMEGAQQEQHEKPIELRFHRTVQTKKFSVSFGSMEIDSL